jgi:GTP-binding protein
MPPRRQVVSNVKITELLMTEGLERKPRPTRGRPGDIIAIAGIDDIMIGETLADPDDPRAAAHHRRRAGHLDDHRHQHLAAGRARVRAQGHRAPGQGPARARARRQRLDPGAPTDRPDTWEVQGRGELALAILVEQMRREGFELTVGKPQVVTKLVDGKVHEPWSG